MRPRYLLPLLLLVLLTPIAAVFLSGCDNGPETELLRAALRQEDSSVRYVTVCENGAVQDTDAFSPDTRCLYRTEEGAFRSTVEDRRVVNTLTSTRLLDADGQTVPAQGPLLDALQAVAGQVDHDILACTLAQVNGRCFAFVWINVNWQSPCVLYLAEDGSLTELARWDSVELLGMG